MNQSIYTEYSNLTPDEIQWLDGCGATWGMGQKFSEFTPTMDCVAFTNCFLQDKKDFYVNNPYTHIPTGSEFCERVAEILGIEKPVFGESLLSGDPPTFDEIREANVFGTVSGSAPSDATKEALSKIGNMPVNPAHRTYRVLDSLDGIPFDTRMPLSEWIPPFGVDLIFISDADWYRGIVHAMDQRFIYLLVKGEEKECIVPLDGHWMRIV